MKHAVLLLLVIALLAFCGPSYAHKLSDSYLTLQVPAGGNVIAGQWDIALRDLEHAVGVDENGDAAITWGELKRRQPALTAYALSRLSIEGGESSNRSICPLRFSELLTDRHVDGGYAVIRFTGECASPPRQIAVRYALLFDVDPNHRGLLSVSLGDSTRAGVLSAAEPVATFDLERSNRWAQFRSFVGEGIWHILHGYDHVLFLLTLLLPAVVVPGSKHWQPRESVGSSLVDVVKVVTAFTLAHSLTLSAAALGWVNIPSRLVESAIAFTVVLGALNNLYPVVTERRWLVALIFGLIHGLGFASVLGDLGLERGNLATALLAFNVGVEVGQLGIVLVFVPIAHYLRMTFFYRRIVMPGAAVAITGIASYWLIVRAFDL